MTIRVTDDGIPSRTASAFVVFSTVISPEIDLVGNNRSIADGDETPELLDHTDFGPSELGVEVVTRTYRIDNLGTSTISLTGHQLSRSLESTQTISSDVATVGVD